MDIVIEGKINSDEGMDDVIQIVVDLKNLPNPVLRVTSLSDELQGRIAFSQGHILGARVNNTDEVGYPAIRKLLSITAGTYAILDPGRQPMSDINQTLWIEATKVIALLPNLPSTPDSLMEIKPDFIANASKIESIEVPVTAPSRGPTTVGSVKSKTRSYRNPWAPVVSLAAWGTVAALVAWSVITYGDRIAAAAMLLVHPH